MSSVTVVLIKNKKLQLVDCHWRDVAHILRKETLLENTTKLTLDAGYLLLDFDKKLFVSSQNALALPTEGWAGYYI